MTAEKPNPPPTGLLAELFEEGYRFDFFQAVRVLERAAAERSPIGHDVEPQREAVRFGAWPSVEFPASEIYDLRAAKGGKNPPLLTVTFFGMFGPLGALPQRYTEIVQERLARKDATLHDFLNLFNHRLLSLFYRAWEKYQFWLSSERAMAREIELRTESPEHWRAFVLEQRPRLDPLGQALLDFVGLGGPAHRYRLSNRDDLEPRTTIADQSWRFYAGLLSQRHRCAVSLERMLSDHFGWDVRFQPFSGRWLQLEPEDCTRLSPGGHTSLGRDCIAGRKVWELQGKFRLQVGPVDYQQFCSALPIGAAHQPLAQLTRFYVGKQFDFDVELRLRSEEIPELRCGDRRGIGPRLGWNTWLKSRTRTSPVAAVVLHVDDDAALQG